MGVYTVRGYNDEQKRSTHTTHGMSKTPMYQRWAKMMQRCYNPNNSRYARYGARGITVCERWHTFANWYADIVGVLGPVPSRWHTLGRIDNAGHYELHHRDTGAVQVRWATPQEQALNRENRVPEAKPLTGLLSTLEVYAKGDGLIHKDEATVTALTAQC
jgi:hypothetical protein